MKYFSGTVKGYKNYYSLQGTGHSRHVQSYPLPLFQLYHLSAHPISRIIRRFCLQGIDISNWMQFKCNYSGQTALSSQAGPGLFN